MLKLPQDGFRTCKKCGEEKDLQSEFHKHSFYNGRWRYNHSCIECTKIYNRKLRAENAIRGKNTGGTKICIRCNEEKSREKYHLSDTQKDGRAKYCKECRIEIWYKETYDISMEDYNNVHRKQSGKCAICKNPETKVHALSKELRGLSLDHNHLTGKNRGLLCSSCNAGIGFLQDNVKIIKSAAQYLEGFI